MTVKVVLQCKPPPMPQRCSNHKHFFQLFRLLLFSDIVKYANYVTWFWKLLENNPAGCRLPIYAVRKVYFTQRQKIKFVHHTKTLYFQLSISHEQISKICTPYTHIRSKHVHPTQTKHTKMFLVHEQINTFFIIHIT